MRKYDVVLRSTFLTQLELSISLMLLQPPTTVSDLDSAFGALKYTFPDAVPETTDVTLNLQADGNVVVVNQADNVARFVLFGGTLQTGIPVHYSPVVERGQPATWSFDEVLIAN